MSRGRLEVYPAAALSQLGELRQAALGQQALDAWDGNGVELVDGEHVTTLRIRGRA